MNWKDNGYLLSKLKYNENSSIVEFFTENHGKCSGLIFGATSKKIKNYLEIGNKFHLQYSYKNDGRVGYFKIEIENINTPKYLDNKKTIDGDIYNLTKKITNNFIDYLIWIEI